LDVRCTFAEAELVILAIDFAPKKTYHLVSMYKLLNMLWVTTVLLNWWFEYCYFNKYLILYTSTGVVNWFVSRNIA